MTPTTKTLILAGFVAFSAAGLYAADRTFRPATHPVALAPQPGPAIQRDADEVPQPRECDELKGIETQCTY